MGWGVGVLRVRCQGDDLRDPHIWTVHGDHRLRWYRWQGIMGICGVFLETVGVCGWGVLPSCGSES